MNVYDAAVERISYIFKEFDNVCVSFSGGKDSGVLLNLCIDFVREHYPGRKIGVFHIDYEAQYQMTTDYATEVMTTNLDILDVYWCCMPIAAGCATSMYSDHWIPWEAEKEDIWVRDMPENCINESNHEFDWFKVGMRDYDFQERFALWLHERSGANKTACLVGIRTEESFNRWRAIYSDKNKNKHNDKSWTLEFSSELINAYPIFDWKVGDVWTANARLGWSYNKLYDLFHQAGVTPHNMRVSSPFHDCAIESLKLYKAIDPKNWGKMIGRTNGVNFAGLYGGTTAMGWKSIKLPKGHTWKSYMEFLLTTLPKVAQDNYKKKLQTSEEFWINKGGCLSSEVVQKLDDMGVDFEIGEKTNYRTEKLPVKMEYLDDIGITEFKEIPTYKRMCVCIMKNDHLCKYMGFSLNKTERELRSSADAKYKNISK